MAIKEGESISMFVPAGADFDNAWANSLVHEVRNVRSLGYEPALVLARSDFEGLAGFWPEFYLVAQMKVPRKGRFVTWLKKLLRKGATVIISESLYFSYTIIPSSGSATIRPNRNVLAKTRAAILERKAIPVDGIWIDVEVIDDG